MGTALHSTLFILVHAFGRFCGLTKNFSTFHSVYISTLGKRFGLYTEKALHSTLFILVQGYQLYYTFEAYSTFHSVYISTIEYRELSDDNKPLHSTLFILVQNPFGSTYRNHIPLHSTLFILVLFHFSSMEYVFPPSTFHSVYISTGN